MLESVSILSVVLVGYSPSHTDAPSAFTLRIALQKVRISEMTTKAVPLERYRHMTTHSRSIVFLPVPLGPIMR